MYMYLYIFKGAQFSSIIFHKAQEKWESYEYSLACLGFIKAFLFDLFLLLPRFRATLMRVQGTF